MYGYEPEPRMPRFVKPLVTVIVLALVVYWFFSFLFRLFGVGNTLERQAATLLLDGRGTVTVSLQGESPQTAQNGMNMFPGDAITTASTAHAALRFFDGTRTRTDGQTELEINESAQGESESDIELTLTRGALWLQAPTARAFTGAITRVIHTPNFTITLPSDAEIVVDATMFEVFSADGAGVTVTRSGQEDFAIGEGQKWTVPADGEAMSDDPFSTRTVLTGEDRDNEFLLESRQKARQNGTSLSGSSSSESVTSSTSSAATQTPTTPSGDAPTVTSPAATGQTYRTNTEEIVIRGTSPKTAVAMYVNNYKLQLFSPEKGTWSYLASVALGNMKQGENVYSVVSEDAEGNKSAPAVITIVVGEGESGATSSSTAIDPSTLPNNAPLAAGTLTVTGPTAGTTHAETGTGFLLEGKTSADTASVWVNNYRLQLYTAGKTTWNYIASVEYGNLKRGENTYKIVARNEKNEILDTMEYKVTFTPGE